MPDFLTSDGVRIHYERHGRGPRVYVLHGGPANDFRYMAEPGIIDDPSFATLPASCVEHFEKSTRPPVWPDRLGAHS